MMMMMVMIRTILSFHLSIKSATVCFIIQILSKPFLVKYFGEILSFESFDNIGILFSTTDWDLAQNPENNTGIFSTLFTHNLEVLFENAFQQEYNKIIFLYHSS